MKKTTLGGIIAGTAIVSGLIGAEIANRLSDEVINIRRDLASDEIFVSTRAQGIAGIGDEVTHITYTPGNRALDFYLANKLKEEGIQPYSN